MKCVRCDTKMELAALKYRIRYIEVQDTPGFICPNCGRTQYTKKAALMILYDYAYNNLKVRSLVDSMSNNKEGYKPVAYEDLLHLGLQVLQECPAHSTGRYL